MWVNSCRRRGLNRRVLRLAAVLLLAIWSCAGLASRPAGAGDPEPGRKLVQKWCSSCHYVEGSDAASDAAPAFSEIANRPTATEGGWRAWLSDPHPPMPNLHLSNEEIDAVIAFLKSLRAK